MNLFTLNQTTSDTYISINTDGIIGAGTGPRQLIKPIGGDDMTPGKPPVPAVEA